MSNRRELEDMYTVHCPACKTDWINIEKGPVQNMEICPTCKLKVSPEEWEWIEHGDDPDQCSCEASCTNSRGCSMCCPCEDCQKIRLESLMDDKAP
jgi:hypothetical protein